MNAAHVHLMLNHFSVIGSIFWLVLLAVAMVRNCRELITVSFACLASVAIISIPVYFTGKPAENVIEHLAGVSEEIVERHEEAAQFAFTGIECVGALALAGLWLFRTEPPPRWFLAILLVGSLLTAGAMIYTANRGRQIRHPEIATDLGGYVDTCCDAGLFRLKATDMATTGLASWHTSRNARPADSARETSDRTPRGR